MGIAGPHELIVFARRGPAQISYRGETETIAEGKSYRVRLNDSDDGTPGEPDAKKPGRHGKALVLIVVGATVGSGSRSAVGRRYEREHRESGQAVKQTPLRSIRGMLAGRGALA